MNSEKYEPMFPNMHSKNNITIEKINHDDLLRKQIKNDSLYELAFAKYIHCKSKYYGACERVDVLVTNAKVESSMLNNLIQDFHQTEMNMKSAYDEFFVIHNERIAKNLPTFLCV